MTDSPDTKSEVSNISFRKAQRKDIEDIVRLLADDKLGSTREDVTTPPNPKYIAAFEAIDRDPNQLLLLAIEQGAVVGCLQLTFIPGLSRLGMWRGQIEGVRVAQSHRGKGIGKMLFDEAIRICRKHDCELVQLTTDKTRPEAIKFYESFGFRASHEGMKLQLTP